MRSARPFEGVIPNLERRYKETESDWSREELERYMSETPCEACARLPPQARGAGGQDRRQAHRRSQPAVRQGRRALGARLPQEARRQAQRDRPAHPEGDQRPADLPGRRRARLSDAVARLGHAVGRREPAHPARLADRLGPDRRALCARRALDRPAPARQRAPARHAAGACATSAIRCSWSSTTRRRSSPPTMSSTSAPAPACTAAR